MPMLRQDAKLGMAMRFEVTIDEMPLGGWSKCDGLAVEFEYKEWKEGGTNGYTAFLPNGIKYSEVTLVRAINTDDSAKVMQFLSSKAAKFAPGTAVIKLYDALHTPVNPKPPVATWTLRNVVPKQWKGPQLNAMGSEIATETLVLKHEGFLLEM